MAWLDKFKKKSKIEPSKKEQGKKRYAVTTETHPFLKDIKPKDRMIFHSDYFEIDSVYCTILSFFHRAGAEDQFDPFWGIAQIPFGLPEGVTTLNFDQVKRMGESWIKEHQSKAEDVADVNESEGYRAGQTTHKIKATKTKLDLEMIARELNAGASYLNVQSRLLVKAPTLERLDEAVKIIERYYNDALGTLWVSAYTGSQKNEIENLFGWDNKKKGKGFYFTSTEYAGHYNLITHGLDDPDGEYVGDMTGDVNNSAILFNVNRFASHVVVSSEQENAARGFVNVADMWGSKISQSCLLDGGRVVHIILDNADLDLLGPRFEGITTRLDMGRGDVNPFEMFGAYEDELVIFSNQLEKLWLMTQQYTTTSPEKIDSIRNSLQDVAVQFYKDYHMWVSNARDNRDKLRIVGVPHEDIPTLKDFVMHLQMVHNGLLGSADTSRIESVNTIFGAFRNLLDTAGDLFNTKTTPLIDKAKQGRRVIYDFSSVMKRGESSNAMAQLVNILGFAVGNLQRGDLLIIHGAEAIDESVKPYVTKQLERLYDNGARSALLYTKNEKFLADKEFNDFGKADYTILGNLEATEVEKYTKLLNMEIPMELKNLLTSRSEAVCYIRRGFDNVIFEQNLILDPQETASPKRSRRVRS